MRIGLFYQGLDTRGGYPEDFRELATWIESHGHSVIQYPRPNLDATITALRRNRDRLDILHIVGLYLPSNFLVAWAARSGRIPYVCSLLAQHAPALIAQRRTAQKRLYLRSYSRHVVLQSRAVHFFSEWERRMAPSWTLPWFEAGMGIPPPGFQAPERRPEGGFLYFGRNDVYQKGLDILLKAFAVALPSLSALEHLVIAGRHHEDSARQISDLIDHLGLRGRVSLGGPSDDESPIGQARVLVYPSRYDGPPRPPRAALSMGVPVVVTTSTNLGDGVAAYDAGWVAEPSVQSLADSLKEAARADAVEIASKSSNALKLAMRWSWQRVAEDYVAGYEASLSR